MAREGGTWPKSALKSQSPVSSSSPEACNFRNVPLAGLALEPVSEALWARDYLGDENTQQEKGLLPGGPWGEGT